MDRITDEHMHLIMKAVSEKVRAMGYDFSRIFVDASNMYTFMEENDMARKGHNKKHRYDLNQISYYIAANYDYIPLFWNAYAGNVHDSKTFPDMVRQIPEDSIIIFDRGYNSADNVRLIENRKYIGALVLSDHSDLLDLPVGEDSFIETEKTVYGRKHRIILYHSSKLQRKRIISFMKKFRKAYIRTRNMVESGDSDSMERAMSYLESRNLNETIILPDMHVDHERMKRRLKLLGMNALFTDIADMSADAIIDLYRKRNRVEHCFRTINTMDIAFPIYHWTPQKIKVHMFMSLLAYLFLALIYNRMRSVDERVSLVSARDILNSVRIQYVLSGKEVTKKIDSASLEARRIAEELNLMSVA